MTPLRQRVVLRSHLNRVVTEAAMEVFSAAGVSDDTPLQEVAAGLGDDHPAVAWLHTVGLGVAYRDAIAEREGWPSEADDEREIMRLVRPAGTA